MPRILFVCTANQCRSPVAEVIFQRLLQEYDQTADWRVESAGTWARSGLPAHPQMQALARQAGLDLTRHRTCSIDDLPSLATYELIVTMAHHQREALQAEFPMLFERICTLSSLVNLSFDVDDPIGGPPLHYQHTFAQIEQLLRRAMPRILALVPA